MAGEEDTAEQAGDQYLPFDAAVEILHLRLGWPRDEAERRLSRLGRERHLRTQGGWKSEQVRVPETRYYVTRERFFGFGARYAKADLEHFIAEVAVPAAATPLPQGEVVESAPATADRKGIGGSRRKFPWDATRRCVRRLATRSAAAGRVKRGRSP